MQLLDRPPFVRVRPGTPDKERLAAKVIKAENGCWIWNGKTDRDGYGAVQVGKRYWQAHRWSYETLVGPIPAGLTIDHLCRVRNCVNPDHLEPVTHQENMARALPFRTCANAKSAPRSEQCFRGHTYDEANTRLRIRGERTVRVCRTCEREYQAARPPRNRTRRLQAHPPS